MRAVVSSPWSWITVVVGALVPRACGRRCSGGRGRGSSPTSSSTPTCARSVADGHLPAVRGATSLGWGVVYPLIVAPAWLLRENGLDAYRAALVVNALVMSLAAVPAFLFARLVVARRAALLVAAGAVLVPTMALTGSVMTENAAYPLFLTALWLMARAVRSPTLPAQGAALGCLALLVLTRVQGVVLAPAFVVGVATYAVLLDGRIEAGVPPAIHADRRGAGARRRRGRRGFGGRMGRGRCWRVARARPVTSSSRRCRASSTCSWADCS